MLHEEIWIQIIKIVSATFFEQNQKKVCGSIWSVKQLLCFVLFCVFVTDTFRTDRSVDFSSCRQEVWAATADLSGAKAATRSRCSNLISRFYCGLFFIASISSRLAGLNGQVAAWSSRRVIESAELKAAATIFVSCREDDGAAASLRPPPWRFV